MFGIAENAPYVNEGWETLAAICIAPLSLWGPITIVLGLAYHRRRKVTKA
ncbi:hypothetical protein [Amycolatopsis keratiniphila]|uniref:Uncharacterized protein n=1 Tax=Amycolatopsis keratiniphila TaxID=129921 RepID=R4SZV9_9PSEU|nr:hypothetical protein [Amycolatopsis keratiniphila]AGM03963.1 hypothetical protein AORI_1374 [Amycolatopsis keratiniphila]